MPKSTRPNSGRIYGTQPSAEQANQCANGS